jgi:hypothetical protein
MAAAFTNRPAEPHGPRHVRIADSATGGDQR